jgi:hypothetical protein
MPSDTVLSSMSENYDIYINLINNVSKWSEDAARYGPCFFGVLLIVSAVILTLLKRNKIITISMTIVGLIAIVIAIITGIGILKPTYVYTMRINKLASSNILALTDSLPQLYRNNRVYDTEQDSYHIELVAISLVKIMEGHPFKVIITEDKIFTMDDGSRKPSRIKYEPIIPFNGKPFSIYEIQKKESTDEEGIDKYIIVPVPAIAKRKTKQPIVSFFSISKAFAGNQVRQNIFPSSSPINLAQITHTSSDGQTTHRPAEESGETICKIIYFEKSSDEAKVRSALSKADITYAVQKSKLDQPSNAVWIGTDVPANLVKKIGKSLIEEGISLRYFGFFESRSANTNIVQIGYSQKSVENEIITSDHVLAFAHQLSAMQEAQKESREEYHQINIQVQDIIKQQQQKLFK